MTTENLPPDIFREIISRVNVGLVVIDRAFTVTTWNAFMEQHSNKRADEVVGKSLLESFPELPQKWMIQKIEELVTIKNYLFTSWEQRPFLFKFKPHRPITGGVDFMRQNCSFIPIMDNAGEVATICIVVHDATDAYMYHAMLQGAMNNLAEISNRDGLTQVFNRHYFETTLRMEFERAKRYDTPISLILLDLDWFKKINDVYGHLAGDQVLRVAAMSAQQGLRKVDVLARYGGEEFAIILPQTRLAGALLVAERLRAKLALQRIRFDANELSITASFGVCEASKEMQKYETLLSYTDIALYASKDQGRNRITAFHPNLISNYHNTLRNDRG